MTRRPAKHVPGSAKVGPHDTRSSDLSGQGADEVASHSERASRDRKPKTKTPPASGEVEGALRDQVGKG
ncbi:hypothetical protein [Sediminicoccus sp. BL-A-41-H5]|uniref:hypothetical protein n=1 Tax=Sediminicoccus sp. BL-A-41-H5 TaxID=3421106 RepID=UPI003D66E43C